MKYNHNVLFVSLVFSSCIFLSCKTTRVTKFDRESTQIIENFLGQLGTDNDLNALKNLLSSNPNIPLTDSSTINLMDRFKILNEYSGKYVGNVQIRTKKLKDDVSIYSYLVKYEKKFYRFVFIFYKTSTVNIVKFSFDDDINFEMEQAIKLYF
jgi:hypothetical protein